MASFTDLSPISFNPYIQQLPVEEMVAVGIEKQRRYDVGVEKIQSAIDNIAGLDIMKDADKSYLHSLLSDVGGTLKTVAMGDFSNNQLVNSMTGMVGKIGKDQNIQNAVYSTKSIRQQLERMKDAQKNGKSSVNREYDFYNELNSYLGDGKVGTLYEGKFKEHIDVNKKVLDVIQKLHPNVSVYDIPFATNEDGSVNYKIIADAMQRKGETGVSEGQIKTAVNAILDADDYDELASQGRYNYKDFGPEDLLKQTTISYSNSKKYYQEKLDELERKKLIVTDPAQQISINDAISYYKSMIGENGNPGRLEENYQSTILSISNNPDGARANLYTRNWLDQIANGFSYNEVKDEILSNPYKENFWKQKNYELDVIKEQNLQADRLATRDLAERKFEWEKNKPDPNSPSPPYFDRKGDQTTQQLNSLQNWANKNDSLVRENNQILTELSQKASTPTARVKETDILKNIEDYKNNRYHPKTLYEKERFDTYIKNSNYLATQKELYNVYEEEAYKELSGGSGAQENIKKQLQGRGDVVITTDDGEQLRFSPKEMYEFLQKESTYSVPNSGLLSYAISKNQLLTEKEEKLKKVISKRYTKPGGFTGFSSVDKYIDAMSEVIGKTKTLSSEVTKKVAEKLAPVTGDFATEQASIQFKDNNEKDRFISALTAVAQADLSQKTGGENYNPKDAIQLFESKNAEDVNFQLERRGDKYIVQVTDVKHPKNTQSIPVDANFVAGNKSLGEAYITPNMNLADRMLRNNGSTNIFKDYTHAFYTSGDFGSFDNNGNRTVTLPIAADLEESGNDLYVTFRLKTTKGELPLYFPMPVEYSEFTARYLPALSDADIIKLYKTQYPNIESIIKK